MTISNTLSWQKVKDVVYVFDEEKESVIKFENVAADIWNLISDGKDISDIVKIISSKYRVDNRQVQADIDEFILDLERASYLV